MFNYKAVKSFMTNVCINMTVGNTGFLAQRKFRRRLNLFKGLMLVIKDNKGCVCINIKKQHTYIFMYFVKIKFSF